MRFETIVMLGLTFGASPVAAQQAVPDSTTPAVATSATKPVVPASEKKVCRSMEVTGSIMMGKRICHTRAEWAKIDGTNATAVDTFRSDRSRNAVP